MMKIGTFTNWNFTGNWSIIEGISYPYLDWFFNSPPIVISGWAYTDSWSTPLGGGAKINLAAQGDVESIAYTGNNSFYYHVVNSTHANDVFLLYIVNNSTKGNLLLYTGGAHKTDLNLIFDTSGIMVKVYSTSGTAVKNSGIATARGALVSSGLLFTTTGNHLSINSGIHFITLSNTPFQLDGNIATAGAGTIVFNSPVTALTSSTLTGSTVDFKTTFNGAGGVTIAGNAQLRGIVGGTTPLTSLNISGTSNIWADVTTTGYQHYQGAVTLENGDRTLNGSQVMLGSTLSNAAGGLTVIGNAELSGDLTTSTFQTYNGEIVLKNGDRIITGDQITFKASVTSIVGGLTINGVLNLGGSITTNGSQTFNGNVTLTDDVTLSITPWTGIITFGSWLNGPFDLTLDSGIGSIVFNANTTLDDLVISNAVDVTNHATIMASSFNQVAGTGTTDLGTATLNVSAGSASIVTNNVVGKIIANSLTLGTNSANLVGIVNGSTGQAAIDKIILSNLIRIGTHFFDGMDLFKFTPVGDLLATEDVPFSMDYDADYPTGYILNWSVITTANWLSMNSSSGNLSGTPTNDDVGLFLVNVTVTEELGATIGRSLGLIVVNVNDPPTITTTDVTEAPEDAAYSVDYDATDIDPGADTLTWSIVTDAGWLSLDASSGLLSGTPVNDDIGTYNVQITVNDGNNGTDTANFALIVSNVNDIPVISVVTPPQGNVGEYYELDLNASDEDGDDITWRVSSDADWLIINETTGVLSGTPTEGGTYWALVTADDGNGGKATLNLTIEIEGEAVSLPKIVNVYPEPNDRVEINVIIEIEFSKSISSKAADLSLEDEDGDEVDGDEDYDSEDYILSFELDEDEYLDYGVTYTIVLEGIEIDIGKFDIEEDGDTFTWDFETYSESKADTDDDGMDDKWERQNELDPFDDDDAKDDLDDDGLTNIEEYEAGTDPSNEDSDGDGIPDGWEVDFDMDPNDPDDAEADDDGDGFSEFKAGSDPTDDGDIPGEKEEGDGGSSTWIIALVVIIVIVVLLLLVLMRGKGAKPEMEEKPEGELEEEMDEEDLEDEEMDEEDLDYEEMDEGEPEEDEMDEDEMDDQEEGKGDLEEEDTEDEMEPSDDDLEEGDDEDVPELATSLSPKIRI